MNSFRVGYGYDVHKFVENRPLILGGVEIPHHQGLEGHSDADVLIHAICDAILGAAALGDIGKHFPDTDPEFEGVDSRKLLVYCRNLVREEGYKIGNVDSTVVVQKPKLAPHIDVMRKNLSEDLQLATERISVKATTSEQLGFVGKEEGIAASAVVLLHSD